MQQVLAKVIPIILIILIGYIIKRTQFLNDQAFKGIKKLVMNFGLPSILLISFINIELKVEHIGLTICIILFLLFLNLFGRLLNKIKVISNPVLPYLLSGSAFGLLGISLFQTGFGIEYVGNISILGVGHELFVWIIFMSLMKIDFIGEKFSLSGLKTLVTSPMVISIFLGILINIGGLSSYFSEQPLLNGVLQTITYFAQIATPLILLIVGYDLVFDPQYTKMTIIYVLIRRISLIGFGLLMEYLVIDSFMDLTIWNEYALFTFFLLPPPFAFSTFVDAFGGDKEQGVLANNVVVLDTIICIISFTALVFYANLRI